MPTTELPNIEAAPRPLSGVVSGATCWRVGCSPSGVEWVAYSIGDWGRMRANLQEHWAVALASREAVA